MRHRREANPCSASQAMPASVLRLPAHVTAPQIRVTFRRLRGFLSYTRAAPNPSLSYHPNMNTRSVLLAATVLGAGLLTSAHAALVTLPADKALASQYSELPTPTQIVRFYGLPERFNDATVQFLLTVDAEGNPTSVTGVKPLPSDLTTRVYPALQKWKFTPARDKDGNPVSIQVILPLRLVGLR
jgi:hypothetical protein